ncbi:MAG: diguanylate cyclase [Fusobacteriales bacterium]|jgi:dihydroxyacetone kinase phosphotransfer subunit|nr:diguanylate cyclase [Fusobacteriales bacterium]
MIGLVVVSHNRKLAEEIINFSNEMKQFDFPVENGGGTSSEIYGTEPQIIIDAIKRADKGEGVLIFVDLGSSIMNAEMAVEILGSPEKLYIVDAPLVEGLISAVAGNFPGISAEELKQISEESKNFIKIK